MEILSFWSEDSEELFRRYEIVGPELRNGYDLIGIVSVYKLAEVGRRKDLLRSIRNDSDMLEALNGACFGGQKELVLLMIQWGANNWDRGFANACLGGQREMALLMIQRGAHDWSRGLESACYGGHRELVDLVIQKAGSQWIDWNDGLAGACKGNQQELVYLMIQKGAICCEWCNLFDIEH
jgi:hypothetical protein